MNEQADVLNSLQSASAPLDESQPQQQQEPQAAPDSPRAAVLRSLQQATGKPEWSNPNIPAGERVEDFVRSKAVLAAKGGGEFLNKHWDEVADDMRDHFPGVDPEKAKDFFMLTKRQYELGQGVQAAKEKYKGFVEPGFMTVGREAVPVYSSGLSFNEKREYSDAKQRIASGQYEQGDFAKIAHYEQLQENKAKEPLGKHLLRTGLNVASFIGEAFLGGELLKGAGAAPTIGNLAAEGTTSAVGRAIGKTWLTRTAAQTALMPSMYLPASAEHAIQKGGSWSDVENLGPAYGMGMMQVGLLGIASKGPASATAGKLLPALTESTIRGQATRFLAGTGTALAGQAGIDVTNGVLTSQFPVWGHQGYGTAVELMQGKEGSGRNALSQLVTFALFNAAHSSRTGSADSSKAIMENGSKLLGDLKGSGFSEKAAYSETLKANSVIMDLIQGKGSERIYKALSPRAKAYIDSQSKAMDVPALAAEQAKAPPPPPDVAPASETAQTPTEAAKPPVSQPQTPEAQAKGIEEVFGNLGKGIGDAAKEKVDGYAQRILSGEKGVLDGLNPEGAFAKSVQARLVELQSQGGQSAPEPAKAPEPTPPTPELAPRLKPEGQQHLEEIAKATGMKVKDIKAMDAKTRSWLEEGVAKDNPEMANERRADHGPKEVKLKPAEPGGLFTHVVTDAEGKEIADVTIIPKGDQVHIEWMGLRDTSQKAANRLGRSAVRSILDQVAEQYPEAKEITGLRTTGARKNATSEQQQMAIKIRRPGETKAPVPETIAAPEPVKPSEPAPEPPQAEPPAPKPEPLSVEEFNKQHPEFSVQTRKRVGDSVVPEEMKAAFDNAKLSAKERLVLEEMAKGNSHRVILDNPEFQRLHAREGNAKAKNPGSVSYVEAKAMAKLGVGHKSMAEWQKALAEAPVKGVSFMDPADLAKYAKEAPRAFEPVEADPADADLDTVKSQIEAIEKLLKPVDRIADDTQAITDPAEAMRELAKAQREMEEGDNADEHTYGRRLTTSLRRGGVERVQAEAPSPAAPVESQAIGRNPNAAPPEGGSQAPSPGEADQSGNTSSPGVRSEAAGSQLSGRRLDYTPEPQVEGVIKTLHQLGIETTGSRGFLNSTRNTQATPDTLVRFEKGSIAADTLGRIEAYLKNRPDVQNPRVFDGEIGFAYKWASSERGVNNVQAQSPENAQPAVNVWAGIEKILNEKPSQLTPDQLALQQRIVERDAAKAAAKSQEKADKAAAREKAKADKKAAEEAKMTPKQLARRRAGERAAETAKINRDQLVQQQQEFDAGAVQNGIDPAHLRGETEDVLKQANEYLSEKQQMYDDMMGRLDEFGKEHRMAQANRQSGRGQQFEDQIKGSDDVAEQMAEEWPQFFKGEDAEAKLLELHNEGRPELMTAEEGHQLALLKLVTERENYEAAKAAKTVGFSAEASDAAFTRGEETRGTESAPVGERSAPSAEAGLQESPEGDLSEEHLGGNADFDPSDFGRPEPSGTDGELPGTERRDPLYDFGKRLADEGAAELKKKLGSSIAFSGFDPTIIPSLAKYVAGKIITTGYTIAQFTADAVKRFGEEIRPHLSDIWERAQANVKRVGEELHGAKNAKVDAERAERGFEPIEKVARKGWEEVWDTAKRQVEQNPELGKQLVDDYAARPRAFESEVHQAIVLHERITTQNDYDRVLHNYHESKDASEQLSLRLRSAVLADQLLKVDQVLRQGGSALGGALNARKMMIKEDFSLARMTLEKEAAKGKPLTEAEEKAVLEMHKRIKELQDQLDKGETITPNKARRWIGEKKDVPINTELARVKQKWQSDMAGDRWATKPLNEKVQDVFLKVRRAFVLSSPVVIAKLTSAGAARFGITPIEEAVGSVIGKALPGLRGRAMLETGLNVEAESKALTDGFTKGLQDSIDMLRMKKTEMDVLGQKVSMPQGWLDLLGNIHGALKAPVKRAAFARAMTKGNAWAVENGIDPTDPVVQTRILTESLKAADRSIFMQDNRVVDAWQRGIQSLERPNPLTGKASVGGKALATAGKFLLPIIKVPTNIVAESFTYATGALTGSVQLGRAYAKGIENLPPEQADMIMRQLQKGSLGAAALAVGFFTAGSKGSGSQLFQAGGYYDPDERRRPGDVPVGGLRVAGADVPKYLVHNPLLEMLQIGATMRRAMNAPKGNAVEGMAKAGLGLAEEVPFVKETTEVSKLFGKERERQQFLGSQLKSAVVPAGMSWGAEQIDRKKSDEKTLGLPLGTPVKRQAKTPLEEVQSGVPWWRQGLRPKK